MNITNYVVEDVRGFLNIDRTSNVFDNEIIPHIMGCLTDLSQNGVAVAQAVSPTTTWTDVISKDMIDNPEVFSGIPLYIMLSTKMLFDPPPPSTIPYYKERVSEILWRLQLIYDTREVV